MIENEWMPLATKHNQPFYQVSFFQIKCTANPTLCGWEYREMEGLNLSNLQGCVT
jgi:hypothetical protein